jgi:hypothetical protein
MLGQPPYLQFDDDYDESTQKIRSLRNLAVRGRFHATLAGTSSAA